MQPTIVHGDLKCVSPSLYISIDFISNWCIWQSNIFVTNTSRACIADFGLSNLRDFTVKANSSITIGGTRGFIAPEIYRAAERNELRSLDLRPCDMFAFGVVSYEVRLYQQALPSHSNDLSRYMLERNPSYANVVAIAHLGRHRTFARLADWMKIFGS